MAPNNSHLSSPLFSRNDGEPNDYFQEIMDPNDYYFPEIIKPQMIIILVLNNSYLGSEGFHVFSEIIDLHGPK